MVMLQSMNTEAPSEGGDADKAPQSSAPPTELIGSATSPEQQTGLKISQILPATPPPAEARLSNSLPLFLVIVVTVCAFAGFSYAMWRHNQSGGAVPTLTASSTTELSIPAGAVVIAQCQPGYGTQYAQPKDLPTGPIYDVSQGKIIGVEYIVPQNSKGLKDLPLLSTNYDHIDVQPVTGPAGSSQTQVDMMMVSKTASDAITCSAQSD
jgi:hypothetical protein